MATHVRMEVHVKMLKGWQAVRVRNRLKERFVNILNVRNVIHTQVVSKEVAFVTAPMLETD